MKAQAGSDLEDLIDRARNRPQMSEQELREQRVSFAFGNASMENANITREMVEEADAAQAYEGPEF